MKHKIPSFLNYEDFENFVRDLFCAMQEDQTAFQLFGRKGQKQKGIDILSSDGKIVIQCKLRNEDATATITRKKLIQDIEADLEKTNSLNFKFDKIIFASTFKNDAQIQEHLNKIREQKQLPFLVQYIGWDELVQHAQQQKSIMITYFSNYINPYPLGALGNILEKANYIKYLIDRYHKFQKYIFKNSGKEYRYSTIYSAIRNHFKAQYLHIPENRFEELVEYLTGKIDRTPLGKKRIKENNKNYSKFGNPIDTIENLD